MDKKPRGHIVFLEDIQISMGQVMEFTHGMDFEDFMGDTKTVYAVQMLFTIIGEASKNIPTTLKAKYPEVPWKKMYALRNIVAHEYFGIRYEQLWEIITFNIPQYKIQIDHILRIESKNQ